MVLGVDIGGTNIKFGVIDENYNIVESKLIPTVTEFGDKKIVDDIIETAQEFKNEYSITRIGIGTPGTVDYEKGICIRASSLPYKNTPIVKMVEEKLCIPVKLANDASCAVCGELYAGNGQKYKNIVMLTLGTGVGGGIIIDNKPYFGARGGAGELGHIIIKSDGAECKCGQRGCLEQYASVTALIKATEEAAFKNPESKLAELCKDRVSGKTLFDALNKDCPIAEEVLDDYLTYLAVGITSIIRIFQPDAVVLGGAITNEGDGLLKPLRKKVVLPADIVISELKNDAGIIGAAAMAINGDNL